MNEAMSIIPTCTPRNCTGNSRSMWRAAAERKRANFFSNLEFSVSLPVVSRRRQPAFHHLGNRLTERARTDAVAVVRSALMVKSSPRRRSVAEKTAMVVGGAAVAAVAVPVIAVVAVGKATGKAASSKQGKAVLRTTGRVIAATGRATTRAVVRTTKAIGPTALELGRGVTAGGFVAAKGASAALSSKSSKANAQPSSSRREQAQKPPVAPGPNMFDNPFLVSGANQPARPPAAQAKKADAENPFFL